MHPPFPVCQGNPVFVLSIPLPVQSILSGLSASHPYTREARHEKVRKRMLLFCLKQTIKTREQLSLYVYSFFFLFFIYFSLYLCVWVCQADKKTISDRGGCTGLLATEGSFVWISVRGLSLRFSLVRRRGSSKQTNKNQPYIYTHNPTTLPAVSSLFLCIFLSTSPKTFCHSSCFFASFSFSPCHRWSLVAFTRAHVRVCYNIYIYIFSFSQRWQPHAFNPHPQTKQCSPLATTRSFAGSTGNVGRWRQIRQKPRTVVNAEEAPPSPPCIAYGCGCGGGHALLLDWKAVWGRRGGENKG